MTPQEALAKLSELGADCKSDYDDEAGGWFGWSVDSKSPGTGVLRVTWQPDQRDISADQEWYWTLTAIGGES